MTDAQATDEQLLQRSVHDLELSVRVLNCLDNAGIRCVGDLIQRTESELLRLRFFGFKSLYEVKQVLRHLGLQLAGNPLYPVPDEADVSAEKVSRLHIHRKNDWIAFDDGEEFWAVPVQSVTMVARPGEDSKRDHLFISATVPDSQGLKTCIRFFRSDDVAGDLRRIVDMLGSSPTTKRGSSG